MKPVILTEGRKPGPPDNDRLTIKIFFPRPDGRQTTKGKITLINGKIPLISVRAPAHVVMIHDEKD